MSNFRQGVPLKAVESSRGMLMRGRQAGCEAKSLLSLHNLRLARQARQTAECSARNTIALEGVVGKDFASKLLKAARPTTNLHDYKLARAAATRQAAKRSHAI